MNTNENEIAQAEVVSAEVNRCEAPVTCHEAPGLPLRVLRSLERQGLRIDHGKWRNAATEDSWWIANGEEVTGPVPYQTILNDLLNGEGPVQFAPAVEAEKEPRWRTLDYRPVWRRPMAARCWTIGFWLVVLVMGHGTVQLFTPDRIEWIVLPLYWTAAVAAMLRQRRPRKKQSDREWTPMNTNSESEMERTATDGGGLVQP